MLFYGPGTDVQLSGYLFVAATLYEQIQYLMITWRDFDLAEVYHDFTTPSAIQPSQTDAYLSSNPFAKISPWVTLVLVLTVPRLTGIAIVLILKKRSSQREFPSHNGFREKGVKLPFIGAGVTHSEGARFARAGSGRRSQIG